MSQLAEVIDNNELTRVVQSGEEPSVLGDIYREDVNIVVWQRDLNTSLETTIDDFVNQNTGFQLAMTVAPESVLSALTEEFHSDEYQALADDITRLVDMFCCLFELKSVGLRLRVLNQAMCPKFHVDKVPCRLITTYRGVATDWLPHAIVDRSKLGTGSNGMSDDKSGLYNDETDIQKLSTGDVALLKGEGWHDNLGAGLVHRSPTVTAGENRLLLTLDFAD